MTEFCYNKVMKKIFVMILLFFISLTGVNVFNNTVFASFYPQDITHDFNQNLYKDYHIVSENDFYYVNIETNKIERFNNGIVTSYGSFGNTDGSFTEVKFFKKLKNGEFMILDSLNRLQFFDSNFNHLKTLQHIKDGNNFSLLGNISSITTDIYSNVYLADYSHGYILKANSLANNFEIYKTFTLTENSKITILNTTNEIVILDGGNLIKDALTISVSENNHYIFSDALNYVYVVLDSKIIKLNSSLELISEFESNLGTDYIINLETGKIYYILNNSINLIENFASDISSFTPPVDIQDSILLSSCATFYKTNSQATLLTNPYSNNSELLLNADTLILVVGETTEFEDNFYYVLLAKDKTYPLGYIEKKHLTPLELETLDYHVTPVRPDIKYYKYPTNNLDILNGANLVYGNSYKVNRKIEYNNLIFLEIKLNNNFVYVLENETINTSQNYINLYLQTNARLALYSNYNEIKIYDSNSLENIVLTLNKNTNIKIEESLDNISKVSFIHDNKIVTGYVENKFIVKEQSFIIPITIILAIISIGILVVLIVKYKKELAKRKN